MAATAACQPGCVVFLVGERAVEWIVALIAAYMFLGLRDRTSGGSTHVTVLVVSSLVLGFVFFFRLAH